MAIAPGSRLGPYEILAPLGAGGMGEVYRARDTKLDREVAIKILPDAVSDDRERLARFEREAKVLASLNHPNIAQIYGIAEDENTRGIVMELVPGRTLKGPLPLATALNYAQQISSALEAAHEKGIVHRDLKPANIMVTPAGAIKVLDFGLAAQAPSSPVNSESSPTFTMTSAGVILGTAAYMSPEQARGESVDKRADIWAFGVILYQMLAGKSLFEGKTVADLLAAVLVAEPDLSKVPPKVRKLLARCLEKDSRKRLRDIGDAMALVEDDAPAPAGRSRLPWMAAGALFLVAALAGLGWWRGRQPAEEPQMRLDVDLGQDVSLPWSAGSSNIVISPDGTRLVYVASVSGGPERLYARKLDQPTAVELPGSSGANSPFFSPDGQWVGFSVGEKLYKVPLDGGPPVLLSAPGSSNGSAWGDDGSITTAVLVGGLLRTPSGGGSPITTLKLADGEFTFTAPQILPGGKAILFGCYPEARNAPERVRVEVLSLANRERTVVSQSGASPRYLAVSNQSGYLVYAFRDKLMAVLFDPVRLQKRGSPAPILDDVAFHPGTLESQFDISRNGTLVYRKAGSSADTLTMIQWLDAAGGRQSLLHKVGVYWEARLSPDGKRLVAGVREDGAIGVQVYDFERETWTQLAAGGRLYTTPVWSADGQFIVLSSMTGLYWTRADGASQPQPLLQAQAIQLPSSITVDGKRLAYTQGYGNAGRIWTVPLETAGGQLRAGTPEPFLKSAYMEAHAAFSPDGKWLAYESNSSGAGEVYVRAFPDSGSQWKISNSGGHFPIWPQSGRELLYQSGDQMLAVSYSVKDGAFLPDKPRVWTPKIGGTATGLSPDGKHLLVTVPVDRPNVAKVEHDVVLFQNFVEYLRQHVPESK